MTFPITSQQQQDPPTSGTAMVALGFGIVGMFGIPCFPLAFFALAAVALGFGSLPQIRSGARTGSGAAWAGILLGSLTLGILAAVAIGASVS